MLLFLSSTLQSRCKAQSLPWNKKEGRESVLGKGRDCLTNCGPKMK